MSDKPDKNKEDDEAEGKLPVSGLPPPWDPSQITQEQMQRIWERIKAKLHEKNIKLGDNVGKICPE